MSAASQLPAVAAVETPAMKSRAQRWAEEAAFFDAQAEPLQASALTLDPLALARYTRPVLRRRFNKELRFKAMGPLAGKRILDVGCGSGLNAMQFAKLGATVTGIDLSPKMLETASRCMQVNGVTERVTLLCAPVETVELEENSFDIIWVDATLHHLLDELDSVLQRLIGWTRPGGLLVFAEPVNLFAFLRQLRKTLPVRVAPKASTERPLLRAEIATVMCYLDDPRLRPYMLFGWLDQFILTHHRYERSSWPRRALVNAVALLDYALLSLPGIKRLAATCVIYGRPRKATAKSITGKEKS